MHRILAPLFVLLLGLTVSGCVAESRVVYVEEYPYPGPVYVYGWNTYPYDGGYYFAGGWYGGVYYRQGYYWHHAPFWHAYPRPAPYVIARPVPVRPPPPVHHAPPPRRPR